MRRRRDGNVVVLFIVVVHRLDDDVFLALFRRHRRRLDHLRRFRLGWPLGMAEELVVVQLGPEEEFEAAVVAIVGPEPGRSAVLLKHVALEVGRRCEEASAQVASESRASGERVFNQVRLELERSVEGAVAEAAGVEAALGEEVAGHVRLDLGLAPKNVLTLDALVPPRGRLLDGRRAHHQLTVDVEAVLADVRLLPAGRHPVGDQLGRF